MKNEKEFLDSMWSDIAKDQEELMQEYLVIERERRLRLRNIRIILIPVLCMVTLIFILSLNNLMQYPLIIIISVFAILMSYVLDRLIYKEGEKNGN